MGAAPAELVVVTVIDCGPVIWKVAGMVTLNAWPPSPVTLKVAWVGVGVPKPTAPTVVRAPVAGSMVTVPLPLVGVETTPNTRSWVLVIESWRRIVARKRPLGPLVGDVGASAVKTEKSASAGPVARPESSAAMAMSAPTKKVFDEFRPIGPMVKLPEPGRPGPPARTAVPMVKVRRVSARARPRGPPALVSCTLMFLLQSPVAPVQLMVTMARVAPLLERTAPPPLVMVTLPVVGSTRKLVSPLAAEVTRPRSALVVTWTV